MRIYNLLSTQVHAPGLVQICIDLWKSKDPRKQLRGLKLLAEFRGLPAHVAIRLLEGKQEFEVKGDIVKIVTDEPDNPSRVAVQQLWELLDEVPDCKCEDTLPGCVCMTCRVRKILEKTGNVRKVEDERAIV